MILHTQDNEVMVIRQTDHALLSGFFARELGNNDFLKPEPFESLHRALDARTTLGSLSQTLIRGAYRYLAKTPSRLVLVQLDDACRELEQINLPGTFTEYPNWRRKSGLALEEIAQDVHIAAVVEDVRTRVKGGASTWKPS